MSCSRSKTDSAFGNPEFLKQNRLPKNKDVGRHFQQKQTELRIFHPNIERREIADLVCEQNISLNEVLS